MRPGRFLSVIVVPVAAMVSSTSATSDALPSAPGCPSLTPAVVATGERIFTGSGNCSTCHGPNAGGTAMAPSLHAHQWLNISGSYASIVQLVTTGVPNPKQHQEMMPAKGGAPLTATQVCAVAAYVYSLSHPVSAATAATPRSRVPTAAADRKSTRVTPAIELTAAPARGRGDTTMSATNGDITVQITIRGDAGRYNYYFSATAVAESTGARAAMPSPMTPTPAPASVDTAARAKPISQDASVSPPTGPVSTLAGATPPPECPPIAPAVISDGRSVFTRAGNCFACHGQNAEGTSMAPSLQAHAWLQIDGSYAAIMQLVARGVPKPRQFALPMPPMGGAQLGREQLCAVAAYVYSRSH